MRKIPENPADHPISVQAQRARKAKRDAEAWLSALEADTNAALSRLAKDRDARQQAARAAWADMQAERCARLWRAVVGRVAGDTVLAFNVNANDVAAAERWLTSDARWVANDRELVCLFADADPIRLRRLHEEGALRAHVRDSVGFRRWATRRAKAAAEGRSARYSGDRGAADLATKKGLPENARIALALHGNVTVAARWLKVSPDSLTRLMGSELHRLGMCAALVVGKMSNGRSFARAKLGLKIDAAKLLEEVKRTAAEFGIPIPDVSRPAPAKHSSNPARPASPRVAVLLRGASAGAMEPSARKFTPAELIARATRKPSAAGIGF